MAKIIEMARSLSGEAHDDATDTHDPGNDGDRRQTFQNDIDPGVIRIISKIASEYSSPASDKTAILEAMLPYLKEDRRAALRQAASIARIARAARAVLRELDGGS